jgi:hypothetical protein
MRSIRDYKAEVRPGGTTLGSASPFNIVTKSLTLNNFTLAREIVMEMTDRDRSAAVSPALIDEAAARLMRRHDTHLDSLLERLKEPRMRGVIEPVMTGGGGEIDRLGDDFRVREGSGAGEGDARHHLARQPDLRDGHRPHAQFQYAGEAARLAHRRLDHPRTYMDTLGSRRGWLVIFDRRSAIAWEEKISWREETVAGREIAVVGC